MTPTVSRVDRAYVDDATTKKTFEAAARK